MTYYNTDNRLFSLIVFTISGVPAAQPESTY